MAPPRKTGLNPPLASDTQAGTPNPLTSDPEAANATIAKAKNPFEDPEASNLTQARKPKAGGDPERNNATQAKKPNPFNDPEADNATQAKRSPLVDAAAEIAPSDKTNANAPVPPPPKRKKPAARLDEPEEDYRTGQNYRVPEEDAEQGAPSASLSFEGDGLEALEPDLAPRTRALPAIETDDDEPDAEGDDGGSFDDDDEPEDGNATHAGAPIVLQIVAGPDAGKKKKLKGVRMVVGRTPGVDLQLSDQSVSRQHIEFVKGEKGVIVRDLKSGNGTKVNGTKVSEKLLEHGDEVAIGKTRIRFIDEVSAFRKAQEAKEKAAEEAKAAKAAKAAQEAEEPASQESEAPEGEEAGEGEESAGDEESEEASEDEAAEDSGAQSLDDDGDGDKTNARKVKTEVVKRGKGPVRTSRSTRTAEPTGPLAKFKALPAGMRYAMIGSLGFIVFLMLAFVATRPPPPPPVDPAKVAAEAKMQDARNAIRDAKYAEAVKLIEEAEKQVPGIDKTKLLVQAKDQVAMFGELDNARRSILENKFDDARKSLAKVPPNLNPKLDEARAQLQKDLDAAELKFKVAAIDEALASGDLEGAKAALSALPAEQQGEPAQRVAEFERQLEEQAAADKNASAQGAAAAARARKQKHDEEMLLAFGVVERKFSGAEWDRAASECTRVIQDNPGDAEIIARARMLQNQIPGFGRSYEEGMKKYRQGQLVQAARPLGIAFQSYLQMGLKQNSYQHELADKLVEAGIAAGKDSLLRDDLLGAAQAFRNASKLDPSEARARAGLEEVIGKADELYQVAYSIKGTDPADALRKFKIVVQVTSPGSTTHEKAKNQIAAMQP